jgi:hypothetical protein
MTQTSPYEGLPSQNFWRSGVADPLRRSNKVENVWTPKFEIRSSDRIITVGSCFAQHIGAQLDKLGFHRLQYGLSPRHATSEMIRSFSYPIGNIYTPGMLLQWLEAATDSCPYTHSAHADFVEHDGRWYDLYRPSIPEGGFLSLNDAVDERQQTIRQIRDSLGDVDLVIFTLGLTEGWEDKRGFRLASAPILGRPNYDPRLHHFVNYDFETLKSDLFKCIQIFRRFNSNTKFVLTVSPVPLTATFEQRHVLLSSMFSKSLLRVVAEDFYKSDPHVDYFPSYELINLQSYNDHYFDNNLRTVKNDGVRFVMNHFLEGINEQVLDVKCGSFDHVTRSLENSERIKSNLIMEAASVFCDEGLIDQPFPQIESNFWRGRLFLFGDSHIGKFSGALNAIGIPHNAFSPFGGDEWFKEEFEFIDGRLTKALDRNVEASWELLLKELSAAPQARRFLLTNLGFQTHLAAIALTKSLDLSQLTIQGSLDQLFSRVAAKRLEVLSLLEKFNVKILYVSDPPVRHCYSDFSRYEPYAVAWESAAFRYAVSRGWTPINLAERFGDKLPEIYQRKNTRLILGGSPIPEFIHANRRFYKTALFRCILPLCSHEPEDED